MCVGFDCHSEWSCLQLQLKQGFVYDMWPFRQQYKYLIVNLFFSHFGFWSGNLFLIAPFPDLCLLVLFYHKNRVVLQRIVYLECKGP